MESTSCRHDNIAPLGVINNLPDYQAGPGRHKCAVCSYYKGKDFYHLEKELVSCEHNSFAPLELIESLPEGQGGPGRHKCVICAYHAGLTKVNNISLTISQIEDIASIKKRNISKTEQERLINARIGQGQFRESVFKVEAHCRVTGVQDKKLLIASHIKPWRMCNDEERLDEHNGLMLSPHIDKLFDNGYISFGGSGEFMFSNMVKEVLSCWSIDTKKGVGKFNCKQKVYLSWHRKYLLKR